MGLWRLVLRMTVGLLFVGHGAQKLFGSFGGEGLSETATGMEKLGLQPGRVHAVAAGTAECGGGVLLAAGAEMPFAAAALSATMMTAIKRVHLKNGPWVQNGGYEYNIMLIGLLLALVEAGPGRLSLDSALGRERSGAGWAAMAFGAGALGAYAVDAIADRSVPSPAVLLNEIRSHVPHRMAA
ncbi:MAG TPA: DoxX family protein [Gaiellaceae bacterium]